MVEAITIYPLFSRFVPEARPADDGEILAQVVTCCINPDGSVCEYIRSKSPSATTPSERRLIQEKYADPAYKAYCKALAEGTLPIEIETRSFNYGGLVISEKSQWLLMIEKNSRRPSGLDLPAGNSRRKNPHPWHAFSREVFAEEAVMVTADGHLILPDREGRHALSAVTANYQQVTDALLSQGKNPDFYNPVAEAICHKPFFIKMETPHWLQPALTSFTVIHPDGTTLKENNVLIIVHEQGGDVLFPFVLPVDIDKIRIFDLESIKDGEGEVIPLQRNHFWLSVGELGAFVSGQPVKALAYTDYGLQEVTIDSKTKPLFPLANQAVRKLISIK